MSYHSKGAALIENQRLHDKPTSIDKFGGYRVYYMDSQTHAKNFAGNCLATGDETSMENNDQKRPIRSQLNDSNAHDHQESQVFAGRASSPNSDRPHDGENRGSLAMTDDATRSPIYARYQSSASRQTEIPNEFVDAAQNSPERKRLLQKHHAAIVDFYKQDSGRTGLFRSSRSVYDLIYADGGACVDGSMIETNSGRHEMTGTMRNETVDKNKQQLRWIHLPANLMDWMEVHCIGRCWQCSH